MKGAELLVYKVSLKPMNAAISEGGLAYVKTSTQDSEKSIWDMGIGIFQGGIGQFFTAVFVYSIVQKK